MTGIVQTRIYPEPALCRREMLRYALSKREDEAIASLLEDCLREVRDKLTYKVCYRQLPVEIREDVCHFGAFEVRSGQLARNLRDCNSVILFAATVGTGIDRLITRYGHLSPAKAILFQAIGAERIEALCDTFCETIKQESNLAQKPRFSPGYGDLPLESQKDIFKMLDCPRQIGLTLNDSLLMSPSKSVTAFVGLTEKPQKETETKCSLCSNTECEFRGAL